MNKIIKDLWNQYKFFIGYTIGLISFQIALITALIIAHGVQIGWCLK